MNSHMYQESLPQIPCLQDPFPAYIVCISKRPRQVYEYHLAYFWRQALHPTSRPTNSDLHPLLIYTAHHSSVDRRDDCAERHRVEPLPSVGAGR